MKQKTNRHENPDYTPEQKQYLGIKLTEQEKRSLAEKAYARIVSARKSDPKRFYTNYIKIRWQMLNESYKKEGYTRWFEFELQEFRKFAASHSHIVNIKTDIYDLKMVKGRLVQSRERYTLDYPKHR